MKTSDIIAKASAAAADIKNLDMGILVTKATTLASKIDVNAIKKIANDIVDSPKTDEVKGLARLAGGFLSMAPNYVQGLIGSFKK